MPRHTPRPARILMTGFCSLTLIAGCQTNKGSTTQPTTQMAGSSRVMAMPMNMGHKDIIDTATGPGMEEVTTVVQLIKTAGLVDALKGVGPFTVFAPTNAAFAKLPPGTVDDLMKPENKNKLKMILLYHVHKGDPIMSTDIRNMELSTMQGNALHVTTAGDAVMVNNAKVVKADVQCTNGIIHWVDTVLMP